MDLRRLLFDGHSERLNFLLLLRDSRLEILALLRNRRFLLLDFSMFLKEFIEQHRVDRFVTHRVRFSLGIASNQSGVDLFHFLGHEAKLRDALRIKLFLVMECDRLEREDRFARLIHPSDLILEACRRGCPPELTIGVYENRRTHRSSLSHNASHVGGRLSSYRADTDGVGLASNTNVPDIDVVVARREIATGEIAQGDVADTSCVIQERIVAAGRVAVAGCVGEERKITECRVVRSGCVGEERKTTGSRVPDGSGVGKERVMTIGRVVVPSCVESERSTTRSRVAFAGGVAIERGKTVGRVSNARCIGAKRDRTGGRVRVARCVAVERIKTYGRVLGARCEAEESISALSGVVAGVASVRWWR